MGKYHNAAVAYNALNGLICVYKPACVSVRQVQHTIITNLCRDLNALPDRRLEQRVEIAGATDAALRVALRPNLADHPRACGARHQHADFRARAAAHLGHFTSGVLLLGINAGARLAHRLQAARPARTYRVLGRLGKATDTYCWHGRTAERAAFGHVTRDKLDRVLAHMQAAHQKTMFEMTGLHMDSQSTYELASQGLVRPANGDLPVVYGIKCVHFNPPDFTLEVVAVNEYEKYLCTLVHEAGVQLRSAAHCAALACVRHAAADARHALLRKHWQLRHLLPALQECTQLIGRNLPEPAPHLQPLPQPAAPA